MPPLQNQEQHQLLASPHRRQRLGNSNTAPPPSLPFSISISPNPDMTLDHNQPNPNNKSSFVRQLLRRTHRKRASSPALSEVTTLPPPLPAPLSTTKEAFVDAVAEIGREEPKHVSTENDAGRDATKDIAAEFAEVSEKSSPEAERENTNDPLAASSIQVEADSKEGKGEKARADGEQIDEEGDADMIDENETETTLLDVAPLPLDSNTKQGTKSATGNATQENNPVEKEVTEIMSSDEEAATHEPAKENPNDGSHIIVNLLSETQRAVGEDAKLSTSSVASQGGDDMEVEQEHPAPQPAAEREQPPSVPSPSSSVEIVESPHPRQLAGKPNEEPVAATPMAPKKLRYIEQGIQHFEAADGGSASDSSTDVSSKSTSSPSALSPSENSPEVTALLTPREIYRPSMPSGPFTSPLALLLLPIGIQLFQDVQSAERARRLAEEQSNNQLVAQLSKLQEAHAELLNKHRRTKDRFLRYTGVMQQRLNREKAKRHGTALDKTDDGGSALKPRRLMDLSIMSSSDDEPPEPAKQVHFAKSVVTSPAAKTPQNKASPATSEAVTPAATPKAALTKAGLPLISSTTPKAAPTAVAPTGTLKSGATSTVVTPALKVVSEPAATLPPTGQKLPADATTTPSAEPQCKADNVSPQQTLPTVTPKTAPRASVSFVQQPPATAKPFQGNFATPKRSNVVTPGSIFVKPNQDGGTEASQHPKVNRSASAESQHSENLLSEAVPAGAVGPSKMPPPRPRTPNEDAVDSPNQPKTLFMPQSEDNTAASSPLSCNDDDSVGSDEAVRESMMIEVSESAIEYEQSADVSQASISSSLSTVLGKRVLDPAYNPSQNLSQSQALSHKSQTQSLTRKKSGFVRSFPFKRRKVTPVGDDLFDDSPEAPLRRVLPPATAKAASPPTAYKPMANPYKKPDRPKMPAPAWHNARRKTSANWVSNRPARQFVDDMDMPVISKTKKVGVSPPPAPQAYCSPTSVRPQQPNQAAAAPGPAVVPAPGGNNGKGQPAAFRYHEVVRGAERKNLPCHDCNECKKFFDAVMDGDGARVFRREHLMCQSRHRSRHTPPSTPDDFWELSFQDSIQNQKYNQTPK